MAEKNGGHGLVAFVGVRSNQFPRAMDLARPLRAEGLQRGIGGFHVSGCPAMLPDMPPEIREARDLGITLFAGEAEDGRFDAVLKDAFVRAPAKAHNSMDALPALEGEPLPITPSCRRCSGST